MLNSKNYELKMQKSLDNHKHNLAKLRVGRAHAGILDHIQVDYYGSVLPLNQVANVTVSDVRMITVQAWDAKMTATIEKAIRDSDMGLNPAASGSVIRVPMPPLSEERRKELIKVVKTETEEAKIALRNIRRDANNEFKTDLKAKLISEDEDKRGQDIIQKMLDKFIHEVELVTQQKETELITV